MDEWSIWASPRSSVGFTPNHCVNLYYGCCCLSANHYCGAFTSRLFLFVRRHQGGKQSLSSPVYPADQKLAKPVSGFKKLQKSAAAGGYFGFWLWFLAGLSAGGGSFWFINRETGFA